MKKFQWLNTLLVVSIGCFTATNANADAKPTHKKKNHTAIPHRKLTGRDVAECTKLIDRVAKQDKMPIIPVQSKSFDSASSKIVTHSKASAEVQLFAADNAPNSHLTIKPVASPAPASKITAVNPSVPLATLATQPTFKPTTATLVPASPVHPKTTPAVTKPAPPQHIEISTTPQKPDLNHLQGKSASLAEIEKSKSAHNTQKDKKPPSAAKKPTSDTTKKNI